MQQKLYSIFYALSLLAFVGIWGMIHSPTLQAQTTEDVVWKDMVKTVDTNNDLHKTTGGNDWNGGGASLNTIPANTDGWLEFEVGTVYRGSRGGRGRYPIFMCGLSTSNTDENYTTIDHALYVNGGNLYIRESGTNKNGPHTITSNSTFKVEREGSQIKYFLNNTLVYTSTLTAPTGSLLVDASIYGQGVKHKIVNAIIHYEGGTAPTCTDGIQNGNETGIDCGGDCTACPTCSDGILNNGETSIDCGGANCAACPTCSDGILNNGETSIDCGGPNCSPCSVAATCDDGIQNGDEQGIDCGGSACPCCPTGGGGGGEGLWTSSGNNNLQYSTGDVLIGGTDMNTPGTYKLYVEGGILTEALTTGVKNTGDWSDYVFKEGYHRLTLQEVQAFIQANKHLPNVPSASEVVANGVNVAKMDATLLRQIEELWLHLIDMQKRNEAIRAKNEKIRKEVEALVGELNKNDR